MTRKDRDVSLVVADRRASASRSSRETVAAPAGAS